MKRWRIIIIITIILFICTFAMMRTIRDPAKFTGKWFLASDGSAYLFHNGIIISEKHNIQMDNEEILSGAYSFEKDKIFLFYVDANGIEQAQELYLSSEKNGDALYKMEDGSPIIVFSRNK